MSANADIPSVYLAGPGVVRSIDARGSGEALKCRCAQAGLIGRFRLDNEVSGASPWETAQLIYRANLDLINAAQAIIADISPFRGPYTDAGTAWEIGYGVARGLPVYAWTDEEDDLLTTTRTHVAARNEGGRWIDGG
jgi:nucleoside 2-deoxyribosyltransferase